MAGIMEENTKQNKPQEKASSQPQENLLDKIIEFITGITSDDRIKARKLKEINKELQKLKFKFYNYKKDIVLPKLAEHFYEIFRTSQVLSRYFDTKNHGKSIKLLLFDSIATKDQQKLKANLQSEAITERIKSGNNPAKGVEETKKIFKKYTDSFNLKVVNYINATYNQIVNLSYLVSFDWYFVVHKFDSNISETNIEYKPNFEALDGKYVLEDIIAINDYLMSLDLNSDFKNIYNYLEMVSQDKTIADSLKKLIHIFRILKRDNYLLNIIRLIKKDPYFKAKLFKSKEKIVQEFIMSMQHEVQETVKQCSREIEKENNNKLLMEIFQTTIILRLKNYSEKINDFLHQRGVMQSLKYVEPMNYIKAFLLDICKGMIKPRIDYLIIKGEWASSDLSSKNSELLEKINALTQRVVDFDELCSENGKFGKELRKMSGVLKHDKNARQVITRSMMNIEVEAEKIIYEMNQLLILIGNDIKKLLTDYKSKAPKMIINFHRIKWDFASDFNQDMVQLYKKIANMVTLLRKYVKEPAKEEKKSENESSEE